MHHLSNKNLGLNHTVSCRYIMRNNMLNLNADKGPGLVDNIYKSSNYDIGIDNMHHTLKKQF